MFAVKNSMKRRLARSPWYHYSTLLYFSHDRSNQVWWLAPPDVPLFDKADRVHRTHKAKIRRARLLLPALPLALFFMAASSSSPTRSSDRARIAATQISTILRTL